MKLIIDIPNEIYDDIKHGYICSEYADTLIQLIPSSKPYEEQPQGEWITKNAKEPCGTDESHETIYRLVPRPHCNKCNIPQIRKTYFCPNCGADMRGE